VTDPKTGPTANFAAAPLSGPSPLDVDFTNQSASGSSAITSVQWNFGDGATSAVTSPSHLYGSPGTYTVSLEVTTADGTDTKTRVDYVVVNGPGGPTADFSGTPTEGSVPLTVQFTDRSDPGTATTFSSHSWDFGDGGTSTATNPSHAYALPGTYTVSLTVSTAVGSDSESKSGYITVRPPGVAPTAQFSGTPRTGAAPLDVQFTDLSIPGTAPIGSWSWSFGDGGTSTEANPAHTYAAAGSYAVALTVTTAAGQNTNTEAGYITPCATPAADFTATPTTGFAPLTVTFHDTSTGGPNTFSWSFGDGGTSTAKDLSYIYSAPGTYTVSHTAGNACGNDTSTKTDLITVQDACPNPTYSIVSAVWDNRHDTDKDGIQESARLRWNADVSPSVCARSVYANIYYSPTGTANWVLVGPSSCYTITDARTGDLGSFTVSHLATGCYDFRIVLFECEGTTAVATFEPAADGDLRNQCFEP